MSNIKTFGPVDRRSLAQLERCMDAGDAEFGVLCADHHPGYSQPIGGAVGYEGYISPSGVGYDIGCLAEGTAVGLADGRSVPIESVGPGDPVLCWDGRAVRPASPVDGAVARGRRTVVTLRLANGRELTLTPDHQVRLELGWRRADELRVGDPVACTPHSGEVAWVPVTTVESAGDRPVYDVVTGDRAQSFLAAGVVVHNCGNKAVLTNLRREDLDVAGAMKEISRRISFGMGVPARERVDHPVLDRIREAPFEPQRKMLDLAREQLGTVGSGNHFVNLFVDASGAVWVGVHFGSRGFGHKTATGFLAVAQGLPFDEEERKRLGVKVTEGGMDSPPVLLPLDSEAGQAYVEAMQLAGEYAYAGRDAVVGKVLEILGAEALHEVHNHHNFCWREEHHGRTLWVVRKGCTPAWPGQEGFVGATMGDDSVILEGAEAPESGEALYSTVHGAGRLMSRSQAAGRVKRRTVFECSERDCDFAIPAREYEGQSCPEHPGRRMRKVRTEQVVRPGLVDWPAVRRRMRERGIALVGGGPDEAPEVYKRLPDVLTAHGDTIRVKHTLTPIGVAMAGRDVFDPYKD